jgi:hypothetical protein
MRGPSRKIAPLGPGEDEKYDSRVDDPDYRL